jgi:NitT/TauT family transport system substrate-binding protein/putative hydroxymethylpyrimidine transport system substrate-binding protein
MRPTVTLLTALALAGCGEESRSVTLALDFTPNPVHAPVFAAEGVGFLSPGPGPDGLKLVTSGRAELALLDIHDLAIAREQGTDVVAVGTLVGKPLAALIGRPGLSRPRDLAGKKVGVSGLPSDPAFLKAIVEADGGDYERIEQVTIGFTAVSRLLSRRVDAVPAFWNAEGVVLRERGLDVSEFRVEDFGAPPYPEVVIVTSRKTLRERRDDLRKALKAIRTGIENVRRDPAAAARRVAREAESDDVDLMRAQLDAVLPLFDEDLQPDPGVLEDWAAFDARVGLVKEPPDVGAAFDFSLVE